MDVRPAVHRHADGEGVSVKVAIVRGWKGVIAQKSRWNKEREAEALRTSIANQERNLQARRAHLARLERELANEPTFEIRR